jgi:hypothetical protein
MTKIVLDDARMVEKLDAIRDRSEICDSSGRVLGFYVPQSVGKGVYYKGLKSPVPKEELERRYREEQGRPLSELWSKLKS